MLAQSRVVLEENHTNANPPTIGLAPEPRWLVAIFERTTSPSPQNFALVSSSRRSCSGYTCRYCGGDRMWYRRAVRHAMTKKHRDAYEITTAPPSTDDEADWVDIGDLSVETVTNVLASDPSLPSDHEDYSLSNKYFIPGGSVTPFPLVVGSESGNEVEIEGGMDEDQRDDWIQTWATAGSTCTPAKRSKPRVRN
ncbi:BQ2448_4353 [Microbotryum intermedium]|uniref:BQ2448_4353 protein n=1 Tax=Microbotryum intermedium TaxID=269621 RepID=A0A238FNZ6_9BASI|nr:BQ2448_4353 [Microbotryum intermedium]